MKPFKHEIQKKKWDKLRKKIWLSRGLCTIGGALICGGIIVPIMLTQCKTKQKSSNKESLLDIIGLTELLIPFKTSYEYKCNISDATIKAVDLPSGFSFNGHTLKTPNSIVDALTFKLIANSGGLTCTRTISCFQNDSDVPQNKIILIEGDVKNYYLEYVDVSVTDDTLIVSLTSDQKSVTTGVYFSNITIPSKIGDNFFLRCFALTSIDLSGFTKVEQIGVNFLGECSALTNVDLSRFTNIQQIGDSFLTLCNILISVDLSAFTKVEQIRDGFLSTCQSLTSVNLSGLKNVKEIGSSFLYWCTALRSIDLTGLTNVEQIGDDFIQRCSMTSVDLSGLKNVQQIGDSFLAANFSLISVDLSAFTNVEQIGNNFLQACYSLTSVDLSGLKNVQQIGDNFLNISTALTSVNLSGLKNVKEIGSSFLGNCRSLTSVDLSGFTNVEQIGEERFLAGCQALTSVTVGDNNFFSSITTPIDIMSNVTNTSRNKIFGSEAQAFKDWVNTDGDAISNWEVVA